MRTRIASILVVVGCLTPALAQERSPIEIILERSVVLQGEPVSGAVTAAVPVDEVLVTWSDAFGGVWYSTRVAPRGSEPARFFFQAIGCGTQVSFIEASAGNKATTVPLTVLPAKDSSWSRFVIVADKPPVPSPPIALVCSRLGIGAAIASGYLEALTASKSALRPFVSGLTSGGALSLPQQVITTSTAEYEKAGATKALERAPSLADQAEISRLAGETSRQVALIRRLAPMCLVVADGPSVTRGAVPLDYSFAPVDLEGFAAFLSNRLSGPQSVAAHWGNAATDFSDLKPGTAREIKTRVSKNPDALLDLAPWALHREYMDSSLAAALQSLSNAAGSAARAASDDGLNWSMNVPITAVSGLCGPAAYGGFDYELLPSCADVLMLSSDAPQWSWQLAADLTRNGKVIARIDPKAKDAVAAAWRAVGAGLAGISIEGCGDFVKEIAASAPAKAPAPASSDSPAAARQLAWALEEITAGAGDLMAASSASASVALVYSAAAVRSGWMMDFLAGDGLAPAPQDAGTVALSAWSALLGDLGVDFMWISLSDVRRGILSDSGFDAVIIPQLWSVDQAVADNLRAYVNKGGTLIADNAAGMLDGEYAAQRVTPLDEFFGIRRRPLTGDRIKLLAPMGASDPKRSVMVDDAISITGRASSSSRKIGRTVAAADSPLTVITNGISQGGTVYLNIFVDAYLAGDKAAKDTVRSAVQRAMEIGGIAPSGTVLQNNVPVHVRTSSRVLGRTRIFFVEPAQPLNKAVKLEIRLPVTADCYNLRPAAPEGEYLGNNYVFFVTPPDSGPVILSVEPFAFTGMPVELEYSAKTIHVRVTMEARQEVGDRLFRLETYGPSGEHYRQFDRTVTAAKGMYNGSIDIPENAPAGSYRVLVRDLASGMASWTDVDVY